MPHLNNLHDNFKNRKIYFSFYGKEKIKRTLEKIPFKQ
jgi:hypothetical protein